MASWEHLVGVGLEVVSFTLIPVVLVRRKEPASTLAWILTLVFLPAIGAFLFVAFGSERVRVPARRKREHDAIVRCGSITATSFTQSVCPIRV